MTLPRKVQEQAERSEQLLTSLKEGQQPPLSEAPANQSEPVAPPAATAVTPVSTAPTVPNADPPTPAPAAPAANDDQWEHRYKTLQGKYQAEVPRLSRELRALNTRNEELAAENATLKSKPVAPAQPEPLAPDESMVDPDLLAIIKASALKAARDEMAGVKPDVERIKAERAQRAADDQLAAKRSEFITDLEGIVPDWKAIDDDPQFHAWLADFDEHGHQRHESMMAAINGFNAARAARVFSAFAASRAKPKPAAVAVPPQLQTPDRAGGAPPTATKPNRTFSKEEITRFYREAALGKYTDEQVKDIERDIRLAHEEGRIR